MNSTTTDYGSDMSLLMDLDPMGTVITGRLLLAQALIRRWTTPRGRLLDDPNYGYAVTDELNDDLGPADINQIAANMDAEAIKDERVVSSQTTVQFNPATGFLITTTIIDDGSGPFPLVLQISDVTVTILSQQLLV
jgi:hypothetical protein